ncbi:MAG: TonB-dependent receptor plug domain-containing protein [Pseudomonadota bacterium]
MNRNRLAIALFSVLYLAPAVHRAETAAAAPQAADGASAKAEVAPRELEKVEVTANVYRDRTEAVAPTLSYDLEYFQRFEPLTVGDMLKRVPSVAFLSDVLEYDGVRMRGLDPGYTQILINGERIPGAGFDRSFFVDRIPAELVERIEIVRAHSADRSGDAIAGTLNIVLRDGYSLDGGYVRLGGLRYDDDVTRGTGGAVWGGEFGPGRLLLGANVQGRRNPKDKFSARFDEPGGTLENTEVQTDVRSGTDYSANASYVLPIDGGQLDFSAFYVRTDRLQDEDSIEYRSGIETTPNLLTINANDIDIDTTNWNVEGGWRQEAFGGDNKVRIAYARYDDEQFEFEDEVEYLRDANPFPEDDRFTGDQEFRDLVDKEFSAEFWHERGDDALRWKFGVQYVGKERDTSILADRNRITIPNPPAARPVIPGTFGPFLPPPGGLNTIEEDRLDPFVKASGVSGAFEWEAGLRWQTTDVSIDDATVDADEARSEKDYDEFLPSLHLRWNLSEDDRVTGSIARSMRRPNFDLITPALLEAELGDNDLLGNPDLEPEKAWGFDLGYERRLGQRGVFGVNLFYRVIPDLIEVASTGVEVSEGDGTLVLQPRNTGDGEVWGVEFDLSTPLSAFGLDDTGVFLNYSWLDSEIEDVFGERRFNDQSDYVANIGFIQDLSAWGASFGVTWRKQGEAFGRIVGEEVTTSYGADVEAFIEKRFGERLAVRLTGSNLNDASKDEVFDKFNTIDEQFDRDYDEYELETETGGPVFQLVARYTF